MKTLYHFFLKKQYLAYLAVCVFLSLKGSSIEFYHVNVDSLKNELIKIDNSQAKMSEEMQSEKYKIISEIGKSYYHMEEYDLALPYFRYGFDFSMQNKENANAVNFLLDIGNCYAYKNNNDTAMEHYVRALEFVDSIGQSIDKNFYRFLKGSALINIGAIYSDFMSYPYALSYLKNAEQLFREPPITDSIALVILYLNLGVASLDLNNYEESLFYLNKSKQYTGDSKMLQTLITHNIADVLASNGKIDSALEKYFSSLAFYNKSPNIYLAEKSEVYQRLSELYFKLEDYTTAKLYLDTTFLILKQGGGKKYEVEVLEYAVEYYLAVNNTEKAISYLKKANAIKDSVYNPLVLFNIEKIQYEYDLRKRKKEEASKLELLKKQQILDSYKVYGWLSLLSLLLAISVAILYRQRNQMRKKRINILTLEAEKHRVTDELKYKTSQLTSYAMYINKKNEFMESIKLEVDLLKNEIKNNPTVSKLTNIINHHLTSNQDRKDFDLKIEEANENFYYKLEKEFPSLTKTERKLCSLLLLELSSKEIATLMNIAPRSVDKNRFRLRKKLNVNSDVNLTKFLREI